MASVQSVLRSIASPFAPALLAGGVLLVACTPAATTSTPGAAPSPAPMSAAPPNPDPRIGLRPGLLDAGEAVWNLRLVSKTPPPTAFRGGINSDLAFLGNYVIQGSFRGYQVWDISNPGSPSLRTAYVCPASQSDVSVYKNLLFVSGEDLSARIDCGTQGVTDTVSAARLRGLRIFDISDIANPRNVGNVQTCRGSHTHTAFVDPADSMNVYIYISGSSPVRSPNELAGCISELPEQNPNSALFRIEVVKVPVRNPERATIVSSPRIFTGLTAPKTHGEAPDDIAANARRVAEGRARGEFIITYQGQEVVVNPQLTQSLLDSIVRARGGTGAPTAADTATLRPALSGIITRMFGDGDDADKHGPTQCHDITVYPAIGLAGGACEGYGLLLDISNPENPVRIDAAADSNFSYWHSATFNNDGSKVLFTDEWGGGTAPKCRANDPREWGANAIFTIESRRMRFRSYYKLPAAQTPTENCVAHNGSLVPIPGRDIMVQAWYQGGISIFEWTDASRPREIAFFDRGPVDANRAELAGSWSVYWYNGVMVSSEIMRGLDIFELVPSAFISQNEIDAAKTVRFAYLNAQAQPKLVWPPSFALARAYVDQLERSNGLSGERIASVRQSLTNAERGSGGTRRDALTRLATELDGQATGSDTMKVRTLATALRDLANATR
jgi:hypothetical protein